MGAWVGGLRYFVHAYNLSIRSHILCRTIGMEATAEEEMEEEMVATVVGTTTTTMACIWVSGDTIHKPCWLSASQVH